MIDRSKPCEWVAWQGRSDAFDTDCTGFVNMPYFVPEPPEKCPRCERPIKLSNKVARESAHRFLMANSSMYRILHSPREMVRSAALAIGLAALICWAVIYV